MQALTIRIINSTSTLYETRIHNIIISRREMRVVDQVEAVICRYSTGEVVLCWLVLSMNLRVP